MDITRLSIGLLLFAASGAVAHTQPELTLFFAQYRYVWPQHGARVGFNADYVFYVGEPVVFEMRISNRTATDVRLRSDGSSPTHVIVPKLWLRTTTAVQEIPIRLVPHSPTVLSHREGEVPIPWNDTIDVPALSSLKLPIAVVAEGGLAPGVYELRASSIAAVCEAPCRMVNYGGYFRFEVRPVDEISGELDLLFRRAYRDIEDGKGAESSKLIARMLQLYPTSSAAHQLRARRAERLGQIDEAAGAYALAATLVETGQDRLRLEVEPGSLRGFLRAKANQMGQMKGKR